MATVPTPQTESVLTTPYFVQGAVATNIPARATSIKVTMPGYSVLGDCILVNIFVIASAVQVVSVTDNFVPTRNVWNPSGVGNSYQLLQSVSNGDGTAYVYGAFNIFQTSDPANPGINAFLTVTITLSGPATTTMDAEILEYGNVAFTQNLLHTGSVQDLTGTFPSFTGPSVKTLVPNELLVSYAFGGGGAVSTPTWTIRTSVAAAGSIGFGTADQLADIPGIYTPSWAQTGGGDWTILITGLAAGSPLTTVMQRSIGDTYTNVVNDIGQPSVALLTKGARAADAIPSSMLNIYKQIYQMAASMPVTTGLSYTESLAAGGSRPYNGHG